MRTVSPTKILMVEEDDYYLEDCQRIQRICEEQGWYITTGEALLLWEKASHIEGRGFSWHYLPVKADFIEGDTTGDRFIFATLEPLLLKYENRG